MSKPEFTLLEDPQVKEIIALYERVTGKKATEEEKQDVIKALEKAK
jgi:hypothetical protein